jgi:hypothetical protein
MKTLGKKIRGRKISPLFSAASAQSPATACRCKAGSQFESRATGCFNKININWFSLTKKVFVNDKFCSFLVKHFIFIFRLVQSHAQSGPGSTNRHCNPDRGIFTFTFKKILDYLGCLICNCKHQISPFSDGLFTINVIFNLSIIEVLSIIFFV